MCNRYIKYISNVIVYLKLIRMILSCREKKKLFRIKRYYTFSSILYLHIDSIVYHHLLVITLYNIMYIDIVVVLF